MNIIRLIKKKIHERIFKLWTRDKPVDAIFTRIYQENLWGDSESRSGSGSNDLQTERIRAELPNMIGKFGITSLLDIPCGDFHWMKLVDLNGVDYCGADIVPDVAASNNVKYASQNRRFMTINLIDDPLPQVDLILVRDCMVHLSFAQIHQALSNIADSNSRYLLMTTFTGDRMNRDISTGDWRPLNFCREPFLLPPPIALIQEQSSEFGGKFSDKSLGLWSIPAIASSED